MMWHGEQQLAASACTWTRHAPKMRRRFQSHMNCLAKYKHATCLIACSNRSCSPPTGDRFHFQTNIPNDLLHSHFYPQQLFA